MDKALDVLRRTAALKRLISAEHVLMSETLNLDQFLVPGLSEESLNEIQAILLGLFSTNSGQFSIQCSLFIATRLLKVYKLSKTPQVWDLFNLMISQTQTSTIMAVGYICRNIGYTFKAQLPRIVDHLLKQKANLDYSVAYCLRGVFKSMSSVLDPYIQQVVEFCKRAITKNKQTTTAAVIKLLKVLVRYRSTNISQILDCVKLITKDDQIPFIKNEAGMLLARLAFEPHLTSKTDANAEEEDEWTIDRKSGAHSNEMSEALKVIEMFPALLKMAFPHFLNLLTPEIYEQHHSTLYRFIRSKCENMMSELVPLLPADVRYTYFKDVSEEPVSGSQLALLSALCPDNDSINEVAGVALLLTCSDNAQSRDSALEFFASFTKSRPLASLSYLRSALVYLSQPPLTSSHIESDMRGNASLVHVILSNLQQIEDAVIPNEDVIDQFIDDVFSNINGLSPRLSGALLIMSALPERFARKDIVRGGLAVVLSLLETSRDQKMVAEMTNSLFAFEAKHFDDGILSRLVKFTLSHKNEMTLQSIAALSEIAPISGMMSIDLVRLILSFAFSTAPTTETLKAFISRTLPTGFDLLKIAQPVPMKKRDEQSALMRIVKAFPALLNGLVESDRNQIYNMLMRGQTANSTAHLILLSVCQSPFPMPKDTLTVLLKFMESNNVSQIQIVSECLAFFCVKTPSAIPRVLKFAEKQATTASCVLLSAMFCHARVPEDCLSRAVVQLNAYMKNASLVPFAVHAISSMILTHSIQLSSIGVTTNQMEILFQTLHTTVSMQPVVLHLCSECISLLIEEISSELVSKESSLAKLVNMLLRTIELTPISYAREMYFKCSKSIITFAHHLSDMAMIKFPMFSGAPINLQLAACETFSNALSFEHLFLPVHQLMNQLLILLQRTGDRRITSFIKALASISGDDSLSFWVGTVRRILSGNSLFKDNPIEPSAAVKECCLLVVQIILPKLAEQVILKTEYLDDLISSASTSTETNFLQLQEAAFPVLKLAIELFKERKSETGGRLLDLYDSQFSQAVLTGFKLNLITSGGFLSTYLTFLTSRTSTEESCAVLNNYIQGLSECKQRTTPYYALATDICQIARKWKDTDVNHFVKTMAPVFEEIVVKAMMLWKNRNDWRAMSQFRSLAAQFYIDLLPSFIWMQTIAPSGTSINSYVSFMIAEVLKGREEWMAKAAYEAIPVAIEYFSDQIHLDLVEIIIRIAHQRNDSTFRNIIDNCAKNLKAETAYDNMRETLLSISVNSAKPMASVLARVISSDVNRRLSEYACAVSKYVSNKYTEKQLQNDTALALFSLLFERYPLCIGATVDMVLDLGATHYDFVSSVLRIALPLVKNDIPLTKLSRFCISMFKKGGMVLIGSLLLQNPELGLALLKQGACKASFLLCANDITNARAYLRFIQLSLSTMEDLGIAENLAKSVTRLAMELIKKFGSDVQIGHQIISLCVQVIFAVKRILGDKLFEAEFESFDANEKEVVVELLMKQINKSALRQRNANLVAFSMNTRTRRGGIGDDEEWGELEISD